MGMGLSIIILNILMTDVFRAFSDALLALFRFMEHAIAIGDAML